MRKFLFIGVGGSGGATLRLIRDAISQRLDAAGYRGPFPEAWQFVQIDLPPNDDKSGGRLPVNLGSAYHGIAPVGVTYDQHRRQLASKGDGAPLDNLTSWWPDPNDAPKHPWFGAGQFRAVGRVVTLNRLGEVQRAIDSSVQSMAVDGAITQLREVSSLLGFDSTRTEDQPIALVIGSMAGGTGAGAILDVCDLLRIRGVQAGEGGTFLRSPFAVLYTAAVFGHLSRSAVPGVEPNTLAFISELSALLKNRTPTIPVFHAAAGITAEIVERGPALSFLIGRGNGKVTLADEVSVFQATAQAVATWVVDPRVQSTLQASPIGNLEQLRATQSFLPIHQHEPDDAQPCSSFGYARFEVTQHRFRRYAAERLARQAVDHLLRSHFALAGADKASEEAIAERITPPQVTKFLRSCGLSERDRTENQIIDAILAEAEKSSGSASQAGTTLNADATATATSLTNSVLDASGAAERSFQPDVAVGQLQKRTTAQAVEFERQWGPWLDQGVLSWSRSIQDTVVGVLIDTLSTDSLTVASRMIKLADKHLEAAISELQGEATQIRSYAANSFGHMQLPAAGRRQQVSQSLRSPFVKAATEMLEGSVQVLLRDKSRLAIAEFRSGFLSPLLSALEKAEAELNESWPAVQEWVSGDASPGRFAPAPNEVVLTDIDGYPALLTRLLAETLAVTKGEALNSAVQQLIKSGTGSSEDSGAAAALISFSPWNPDTNTRASFHLETAAEGLRDRASAWLGSDTSTGIGRYLTQPLAESLSAGTSAEVKNFIARFRIALERSEPLIEVSPAMLNDIHQQARPMFQRVMSAIPLSVSPGDPTYDAVADLLADLDIDKAGIPQYFTSDGDAGSASGDIEISTFMSGYHPLVFSSLVNPIATAAQAAAGKGDRKFWLMRRSRPLHQFLPLSEKTLRLMTMGWLTATFLSQVEYSEREQSGHSVLAAAIAVPGASSANFPLPGLGRPPAHRRDVLAAILESYPLAEVQFATGQPSALDAYARLLQIGAGRTLSDWVRTGTTEVGNPPKADTPEERAVLAIERFKEALDAVRSYDNDVILTADSWQLPPRGWELRGLVSSALQELIRDVKDAPAEAVGEVGRVDV